MDSASLLEQDEPCASPRSGAACQRCTTVTCVCSGSGISIASIVGHSNATLLLSCASYEKTVASRGERKHKSSSAKSLGRSLYAWWCQTSARWVDGALRTLSTEMARSSRGVGSTGSADVDNIARTSREATNAGGVPTTCNVAASKVPGKVGKNRPHTHRGPRAIKKRKAIDSTSCPYRSSHRCR